MRKVISNQRSDWKEGFLFVGNQLALDFLNTRPVIDGEPTELIPDFEALLRWFRAAGVLGPRAASKLRQNWDEAARSRRTLERLQAWREWLRKAVVDWEAGGTPPHAVLEGLNQLMAKHPMLIRLKASAGGSAAELWFDPVTREDLFAPIAHSAAMLFATADRSRVRMCGNCVLHFLDTSKKGTRRWCSMQLCGNRLKVAAYAARQQNSK